MKCVANKLLLAHAQVVRGDYSEAIDSIDGAMEEVREVSEIINALEEKVGRVIETTHALDRAIKDLRGGGHIKQKVYIHLMGFVNNIKKELDQSSLQNGEEE
jgi:hypothetical protein